MEKKKLEKGGKSNKIKIDTSTTFIFKNHYFYMRKLTKILTKVVSLMKRYPLMSVHIKFLNVFSDSILGTEKVCLGHLHIKLIFFYSTFMHNLYHEF
jgi:hypothetical protein